jgi:hypothetical protein
MMLVCTVRASGIERGCLALVVNGKIEQWPLLCGEETWILAWAVRVRIAWHHNRLTENTGLFYLSKRVGEETSVMNVESAL